MTMHQILHLREADLAIPLVAFFLLGAFLQPVQAGSKPGEAWRSAWVSKYEDHEQLLGGAKEVGFNAIVSNAGRGDDRCERLEAFAVKAAQQNIETYAVLTPQFPEGAEKSSVAQKMRPEEIELLEKLRAHRDEWMQTHQFGGEPAPGQEDLFGRQLPCFHQPAVREATSRILRKLIREVPTLAGIAFDGFGYENYRNCVCEESLRQLQAHREQHPELSPSDADAAFALDSLVGFINELADEARSLKPGIKTTIHIWPVYLPEPLYGNRLNLDYCGQTVAWFFPPYWPLDKIAAYTRVVTREQNKFFPRARGIPFLGIYLNKNFCADKPLEQFREELRTIFENDPTTNLMIHEFADVLADRSYFDVLREEIGRAEARHRVVP